MGYVGSVSAACFAHVGHKVTGVDVSPAKVEMMAAGRSPIIEARMSELVEEGHRSGMLHATTDAAEAVRNSEISFVCVGTPSLRSGKLDLGYVERVVHEIGIALQKKNSYHVIVLRSTVLPGTTESLVIPTLEKASGRRAGIDFAVCYNPEFMREGSAVADFLQPPYTVLGAQDPKHLILARQLYSTISSPVFETSIAVAEMVKYVCNAFHAVKIGFANEVGSLCKSLGVDAEAVTKIYTADTKLNISPAYLSPGFAFGGSCLPKDLRALAYSAKMRDLELPILDSILQSNQMQIARGLQLIMDKGNKRIGILGFSFKAGTDDVRESPVIEVAERLLGKGYDLRLYDKNVNIASLVGANKDFILNRIPHISKLMVGEIDDVLDHAQTVVIGNKDPEFGNVPERLREDQVLVDFVRVTGGRRSEVGKYDGICW